MWLPTRGMAVTRKGMGWGQSDQAAAGIKGQGTVTTPGSQGAVVPGLFGEVSFPWDGTNSLGMATLSIN